MYVFVYSSICLFIYIRIYSFIYVYSSIYVYLSIYLGPICLFDIIYLLTAIGLTPGGSSTVHIYTQTIHRTTQ